MNRTIFVCLTFVFFILLLFVYKLIPGFYTNSILMTANTKCLINQGILELSYCQNYGQDVGFPFLKGLPFIYKAASLSLLFGLDPFLSNFLVASFLILLALLSATMLFVKLGSNKFVALFVSFIYLTLFINYGHFRHSYLMYGFIFLPFYILSDIYFLEFLSNTRKKTSITLVFLIFALIKTYALFTDGYSFVMSFLCSMLILLSYFLKNIRENKLGTMSASFGVIFSYSIAILAYKFYVPDSASYYVMPADFFRAQGVDLVSLFLPGRNLFFANYLDIYKNWDGFSYYGDSSNVKYNYLGFSILIYSFLYFVIRKKVQTNFYIVPILFSGLIALFLSLGPSIKFDNSRDINSLNPDIPVRKYYMSKGETLLNLNTDALYTDVPGIKNMRAVYRWILVTKLALLVPVALFLTYLVNIRRIKLLLFSCLLVFLEFLPALSLASTHEKSRLDYINENIISEMRSDLKPNEKVLFLARGNFTILNYISSELNIISFNTGGDKNRDISIASWPRIVRHIYESKNLNSNLKIAFDEDLLDVLVVPYFDMSRGASWPPNPSKTHEIKSAKDKLIQNENQELVIREYTWFKSVRKAKSE